MSWAGTENWLSVAGLTLLTIGTGVQAWTALTEFRDILGTLPGEVRDAFSNEFNAVAIIVLASALRPLWSKKPTRNLTTVEVVGWTILAAPFAVVAAIIAAPRKLAQLRKKGGKEGAHAARLARVAALWVVLMIGSALVLSDAVIQLVLA